MNSIHQHKPIQTHNLENNSHLHQVEGAKEHQVVVRILFLAFRIETWERERERWSRVRKEMFAFETTAASHQ